MSVDFGTGPEWEGWVGVTFICQLYNFFVPLNGSCFLLLSPKSVYFFCLFFVVKLLHVGIFWGNSTWSDSRDCPDPRPMELWVKASLTMSNKIYIIPGVFVPYSASLTKQAALKSFISYELHWLPIGYIIKHMKKLLDSDWLRAVQFKCNTNTKSVTPVQKV